MHSSTIQKWGCSFWTSRLDVKLSSGVQRLINTSNDLFMFVYDRAPVLVSVKFKVDDSRLMSSVMSTSLLPSRLVVAIISTTFSVPDCHHWTLDYLCLSYTCLTLTQLSVTCKVSRDGSRLTKKITITILSFDLTAHKAIKRCNFLLR